MFQRLGRFTAEHPWRVCALWVIAGVALDLVAPLWDKRMHDDDIRFVTDRFTIARAYQILEKAFPDDVFASRVVFALEREDQPLSEADFRLVDLLVKDLERLRQDAPELKLGKINSYHDDIIG